MNSVKAVASRRVSHCHDHTSIVRNRRAQQDPLPVRRTQQRRRFSPLPNDLPWTQTTPVLGGTGVDVVVRRVSDGEQLTDQLVDVELGAFGALGDQGDRLVDERGDLLSGCLHEELPIG